MGQISSLFIYKVLSVVDERHDKRALLVSVSLDPDAPVNPKLMVPDDDYYAFFERVARLEEGAVDLPLRVGATMHTDDYGAFGLAWKSAPNLRGSFERTERYARVLTSVSRYEVQDTDDGVLMHLHRDGDLRLGMRLSNEATLASIKAISTEVSTVPFEPLAVYFRHKKPGTSIAHERHFGCPVYFGSERNALLLSAEQLQKPNKLGDQSLAKFFDTHLDGELAAFEDDATLDRRVRNQVSRSLSQGVPRISEVAGGLGMSGRTLQRRLSERGYSYQAVVDEARRELAERLLRETEYPLTEIAFLTGFSEQSAFNRAFKRWAGQTPRSFRIKVQQAPT